MPDRKADPESAQTVAAQLRTFRHELKRGVDWIEALCDDIDSGRVRPRSHVVSRQLAELEGHNEALASEVLQAFDAGGPTPNDLLLKKLWLKIDATEPRKQGLFRTLVALLQPDTPVDSYYADYLIGWAQDEGIPSNAIESAFRTTG